VSENIKLFSFEEYIRKKTKERRYGEKKPKIVPLRVRLHQVLLKEKKSNFSKVFPTSAEAIKLDSLVACGSSSSKDLTSGA
jgi:hypothetical protein